MSKRILRKKICACCEKESEQYEFISRFIPAGTFINRLLDLKECPYCHYVNMDIELPISTKNSNFKDIVESDEYKAYFADDYDSDTASITEMQTKGYQHEINMCKAYVLLTNNRRDKKDAAKVIKHYEELINSYKNLEKN